VNWNAGEEPPFAMTCPEEGTIFRITTSKPTTPPDTFIFTADQPPFYVTTLEGSSVYLKYKLYNNGSKTIKDMYVTMWNDPDLGNANDDFVGCDTLDNIWFCYNADNDDPVYGEAPPAIGFKLLYGPMVPSTGQSAYFDGAWITDYSNLGMTTFHSLFGSAEPDNYSETYGFIRGLTKSGEPYVYNSDTLTFVHSGDPVTGTGDLDFAPADRRMLAASGPFDMRPGDSQFVLIKMAVGQGTDHLNSITELRTILNEPFDPLTDVPGDATPGLPYRFTVRQNYPNPFNPSTVIEYTLPRRSAVTIDIFNVLGQKVCRLVDEVKPAGTHAVSWDGTNKAGGAVSTGLYFYRVKAGDMVASRKMLLLK
jgi:hypothetical protein